MLASKEILTVVLGNAGRPQDSVRRLIEKANAAGGKDNISAIVVETKNFAGSAQQKAERPAVSGFLPAVLRGRWAFLIYGLVAGLLASYAWVRPTFTRSGKPEIPSVHLPGILRVDPGSQEYPTITSALEAARAATASKSETASMKSRSG